MLLRMHIATILRWSTKCHQFSAAERWTSSWWFSILHQMQNSNLIRSLCHRLAQQSRRSCSNIKIHKSLHGKNCNPQLTANLILLWKTDSRLASSPIIEDKWRNKISQTLTDDLCTCNIANQHMCLEFHMRSTCREDNIWILEAVF
jgi:hypothetical protein